MKDFTTVLTVISGLVGTLVSSFVPGEYGFKSMCGQAVSTITQYVFEKLYSWVAGLRKRDKKSSNCELFVGSDDTLFHRFDEYFVSRFGFQVNACDLSLRKGAIGQAMRTQHFNKMFEDSYGTHSVCIQIMLRFSSNAKDKDVTSHTLDEGISTSVSIGGYLQYRITSRTASMEELVRYASSKCELLVSQTEQVLKMYRITEAVEKESGKTGLRKSLTGTLEWEEIEERCNRTTRNVVVSSIVQREFYDDVADFLKNSAWYHQRGVPYRRGFVLFGKPGTGKTASVVATANEHGIPLFMLDLALVKSGNVLQTLIGRITAITRGAPHIVLYDDVDRSGMFDAASYNGCNINLGTLLNTIDGAGSGSGRISILAINDIDKLNRVDHNALLRPGRIDRIVRFYPCDRDQVEAMFRSFYGASALADCNVFRWPSLPAVDTNTSSDLPGPEQNNVLIKAAFTQTQTTSAMVVQAMIVYRDNPVSAFDALFPPLQENESVQGKAHPKPDTDFEKPRIIESSPVSKSLAYDNIMSKTTMPHIAYLALRRLHLQKQQSNQVISALRAERDKAHNFLLGFDKKEAVWAKRAQLSTERIEKLRRMAGYVKDVKPVSHSERSRRGRPRLPKNDPTRIGVIASVGIDPTQPGLDDSNNDTQEGEKQDDRDRKELDSEVADIAFSDTPIECPETDLQPFGEIIEVDKIDFGGQYKRSSKFAGNYLTNLRFKLGENSCVSRDGDCLVPLLKNNPRDSSGEWIEWDESDTILNDNTNGDGNRNENDNAIGSVIKPRYE